MTDIFISYSQKDEKIVKPLIQDLEEWRISVSTSDHNSPTSRGWWSSVKQVIQSCDNFVFFLTKEFIISPVHQLELAYAIEEGKRLIPIDYEDELTQFRDQNLYQTMRASFFNVDLRSLTNLFGQNTEMILSDIGDYKDIQRIIERNWRELHAYNWLIWNYRDKLYKVRQELISVIQLNSPYVKQHTKLGIQAHKWESQRKRKYLLSGKEIRDARLWLLVSRRYNTPKPTPLQIELIRASIRRQTIYRTIAIGITISTIVFAIINLIPTSSIPDFFVELTAQAIQTNASYQTAYWRNTPTFTPTATPTIEAAFLPIRILSVSGIEIGNGTVRLFSPASVSSSGSAIIELELQLDQRYITPTPVGPITPIPVTRVTSIPRPAQFTATPREPIFEETGVTAFQRMGATLYCPSERFTGCEQATDVTEARLIDWNRGGQWSWIVAPLDGVRGLQNLRVELWTIKRVNDGPEQADPIWDHSFQIEVVAQSEPFDLVQIIQENVAAVIGLCGTVVAALIAAGYFRSRQGNKGRSKKTSKAKMTAKTKVFISYRRVGGTSTAQTIKDRLERKGADVFLDVHDINAGRFDEIISKAIADCNYFVLVLAPGTLDSEWVVKEIQHAIKTERTIIPVLVDGYRFGVNPTPAELTAIEKHNGVTLSPEFFDEAIEKLAKFVGLI